MTPGGIAYDSGDIRYTDEWLHESKRQEKRVLVYADESKNVIWIERDWLGPPRDCEQLSMLDWRTGSRWRIDEFGVNLIRYSFIGCLGGALNRSAEYENMLIDRGEERNLDFVDLLFPYLSFFHDFTSQFFWPRNIELIESLTQRLNAILVSYLS